VFACGLPHPSTARMVYARGDDVTVKDGPASASHEFLGGFWVVEAEDDEAAEALAIEGAPKPAATPSRFGACRGPERRSRLGARPREENQALVSVSGCAKELLHGSHSPLVSTVASKVVVSGVTDVVLVKANTRSTELKPGIGS